MKKDSDILICERCGKATTRFEANARKFGEGRCGPCWLTGKLGILRPKPSAKKAK